MRISQARRWRGRDSSTCGSRRASGRSFSNSALTLGAGFGRSALGRGKKVNVEFVSANPTGPLHVGHCRGAVFGDALANLLEATGSKVTREFYINDAGAQIDVLAQSVFLRYREALGESIGEIAAGLYPGDYLKPVGAALAGDMGPSFFRWRRKSGCRSRDEKAIAMMMDMIRADLAVSTSA